MDTTQKIDEAWIAKVIHAYSWRKDGIDRLYDLRESLTRYFDGKFSKRGWETYGRANQATLQALLHTAIPAKLAELLAADED